MPRAPRPAVALAAVSPVGTLGGLHGRTTRRSPLLRRQPTVPVRPLPRARPTKWGAVSLLGDEGRRQFTVIQGLATRWNSGPVMVSREVSEV